MTTWAQLLHFYQPPTQTHEILVKVANESYRPLLAVLAEHPHARVAVNIQGVLTEMLLEHGLGDVVDSLRRLAERGIVEFVGSGKFHPILPLIPEERRVASIAENIRTNAEAFGAAWKPRGFFPPEMCFSKDITSSVAASGHEWLIMSGVGCPAKWPIDHVFRTSTPAGNLAVLFRDDVRSNRISFRETAPDTFIADITSLGGDRESYVLTAMDAETFGHHIKGWEREFLDATYHLLIHEESSGPKGVQMAFPSDLVRNFPSGGLIEPYASSWSTSPDDLAKHNPFPLWKAPGNTLHAMQWELADHCIYLESAARQFSSSPVARKFSRLASERLEPALHSCQFWWASRRPMWDFTMILRGFLILTEVSLDAAHALHLTSLPADVAQEVRWRGAAANELRARIERDLKESPES